jgi:DNA polymerase III subunit delta'
MTNATDIDGLRPPRASHLLLGHEGAEALLAREARSGRLHHAWLLSGPEGIGKATLAFRFARFLLSGAPSRQPLGLLGGADDLSVSPDDAVCGRIAAGSHLDLLTIERQRDEKRDRMRTEITVDDARRIAPFLQATAAEGGWRVVIVDGAEAMNRNAANAILKVLEEPPSNAVLLLVTHGPARLLPTIRSRCRALTLAPLEAPVLSRLMHLHDPDLDPRTAQAVAGLADGSAGRAIALLAADGPTLYAELLDIVASVPRLDLVRVHALADRLARPTEEQAYHTAVDLLDWLLRRVIRMAATGQMPAEVVRGEGSKVAELAALRSPLRWLDAAAAVRRLFDQTDAVYLDRRQAMLNAFLVLAAE